jgi:hypothetical protein
VRDRGVAKSPQCVIPRQTLEGYADTHEKKGPPKRDKWNAAIRPIRRSYTVDGRSRWETQYNERPSSLFGESQTAKDPA